MSRHHCSKPHQAHFPLKVKTVTPQLPQHCVRLTQIVPSNQRTQKYSNRRFIKSQIFTRILMLLWTQWSSEYVHPKVIRWRFPCHHHEGGSKAIAPLILDFCTRCRRLVNYMPQPLYSVREPLYHWIGSWVDPEAGMDVSVKRKSSFRCRESNPVPTIP